MTHLGTGGQSLQAFLEQRQQAPLREAVSACLDLARQLAQLHAQDIIHGRIIPAHIVIDQTAGARLRDRGEVPAPDWSVQRDWLPPELSRLETFDCPETIAAAQAALRTAGSRLSPEQLDCYALGTLLCQLLTHEFPAAYLRSPRVKGAVPTLVRPVLERVLGIGEQQPRLTADELCTALQNLQLQLDQTQALGPTAKGATDDAAERETPVPADTVTVAPELPFSKLGHYVIRERIGGGGMGDVYRAYEPALDRTVAIKVLPQDLARQTDFIARFRSEATAAARLVHPNIIQIYFIGEDAGHHFFAMQYVAGESLADLLRRRNRLELAEVLLIIEQLLAGLGAAHQQGLVHRDIKPGNILLHREQRRALLADFGLVKLLDSTSAGQTSTGVIMGTADYISPEQARGQPVDGRSDLYSLGVLIFQMLSGRLPFEASSATALIFQHVYEQPPDLRQLVPDIPPALVQIIERLLEKIPDDRYPNSDLLLEDLRAFRQGLPLPWLTQHIGEAHGPAFPANARTRFDPDAELPEYLFADKPVKWWEPFRDRCLSMFRRHAPELLDRLQNTQQQVDGAIAACTRKVRRLEEELQQGEQLLADLLNPVPDAGATKLAADNPASIDEAVRSQVDQQEELLNTLRQQHAEAKAKLLKLENQRNILKARLAAVAADERMAGVKRTAPRQWLKRLGTTVAVLLCATVPFLIIPGALSSLLGVFSSFSPGKENSEKLSEQFARPTIQPFRAGVVDLPGVPTCVVVSPFIHSSTHIEFAVGFDDGMVRIYGGNPAAQVSKGAEFRVGQAAVKALAYSTENQWIAAATDAPAVTIWNRIQRREYRKLGQLRHPVRTLQFSDDDQELWGGGVSGLRSWNLQSGQQTKVLTCSDRHLRDNVRTMQLTPQEVEVVIGADVAGGQSLAIWNMQTQQESEVFNTEKGRCWKAAVSLDKQHIVAMSDNLVIGQPSRTALRVWQRGKPDAIRVMGNELECADFSRDCSRAVTGDRKFEVAAWDTVTGDLLESYTGHTGQILGTAVSPGGTVAVSISADKTARVWRLPLPPGHLSYHDGADGPIEAVAFDPKGQDVFFGGRQAGYGRIGATEQFQSLYGGRGESVGAIAYASDEVHSVYATAAEDSDVNELVVQRYFRKHRTLRGHTKQITSVVFSRDSQNILSGSLDGTIRIWDFQREQETGRLNVGTGVTSLAIDPLGLPRCLSAGHESVARLWDLDQKTELRQFQGHTLPVRAVAFSPNGRIAMTASADRTIRLWNTDTGELQRTLEGHAGAVNSIAVSTDGAILLSGSDDCTVRLWELSSGKQLHVFNGHWKSVRSVALNPDQTSAASGSDDRTIRIWKLPKAASPSSGDSDTSTPNSLLTGFQLKRGNPRGEWQLDDKGLLSPHDEAGQLDIHNGSPAEFELELDVERLAGTDYFALGLVVNGSQACLIIDGDEGLSSRVEHVIPDFPSHTQRMWHGRLLSPGKPHHLRCQVRRGLAQLEVDGRLVVRWSGETSILILPPWFHSPERPTLSLATSQGSQFRISNVSLRTLSPIRQFWKEPTDDAARSLQLARQRRVEQPEFAEALWNAAPRMPLVPVLKPDDKFQWHHVRLNTEEIGMAGIRFKSPLSVPGKLCWICAMNDRIPKWNIVSRKGPAPTSQSIRVCSSLELPGLPEGLGGNVLLQSFGGVTIQPWQEYAIWFNLDQIRPADIDCAFRVLPASDSTQELETRDQIAAALGLPIPLKYQDQTGPELARSDASRLPIYHCVVSPDGQWIAAFDDRQWGNPGEIHRVRIHRGSTLDWRHSITVGTPHLLGMAISPDSQKLLTVATDNRLTLWELATGHQLSQIKINELPSANICFTRDGTRVLGGGSGLRVWELETGKSLPIETSAQMVDTSVLIPGPDRLPAITGGNDGYVRLWNIDPIAETRQFQVGDAIQGLSVSPDGKFLAVACSNRPAVGLWDLEKLELVREFVGHETAVGALDFSTDGSRLLSSSARRYLDNEIHTDLHPDFHWKPQDRSVRLWDVATGAELLRLDGHQSSVQFAQLTVDGQRAISAGGDGTIRAWSLALPTTPPPDVGTPLHVFHGHQAPVDQLVVSIDGGLAISSDASADSKLRVWDLTALSETKTLPGLTSHVTCLAMNPANRQLLAASEIGAVQVWDPAQTATDTTMAAPFGQPAQLVSFAQDGRHSLCGSRNFLEVRVLGTDFDTRSVNFPYSDLRAFSADALLTWALTVHENHSSINVWDLQTGLKQKTLEGHSAPVLGVAVVPFGRRAVSAGQDGTLRLWDIVRGRQEHCFAPHAGPILCTAIAPDATTALSGGSDGTLRLWDLKTHAEIWRGNGHQGDVRTVTFTPDGRHALSGGSDHAVCLWELPIAENRDHEDTVDRDIARQVLEQKGTIDLSIGGRTYQNWPAETPLPDRTTLALTRIAVDSPDFMSQAAMSWSQLKDLRSLELASNGFSQELLTSLGQIASLKSLTLSTGQTETIDLTALSSLPGLETLSIRAPQLKQIQLKGLGGLHHVRRLSVPLKLSDEQVQELKTLTNLELIEFNPAVPQAWLSELRVSLPGCQILTSSP